MGSGGLERGTDGQGGLEIDWEGLMGRGGRMEREFDISKIYILDLEK